MRNERERAIEEKFSRFTMTVLYPTRFSSWTVTRIGDKARQETHGDVAFSRNGSTVCVDEKAYRTIWNGCLVELIQDIRTKDLGWFFKLTSCDYLICGYYESEASDLPGMVYKVAWPKLRERYIQLCAEKGGDPLLHKVSLGGWGQTLWAKILWSDITDLAECIYGKPWCVTKEESDKAWASTALRAASRAAQEVVS